MDIIKCLDSLVRIESKYKNHKSSTVNSPISYSMTCTGDGPM